MQKAKHILILHFNIMLFSFTGLFSKFAANSVNQNGVFSLCTFVFVGLMLANCVIYALFWQQNLKHFDVNVAYAHRSAYNIWSLLWAVLIFTEKITVGNVIGTVLIVGGILVMQSE